MQALRPSSIDTKFADHLSFVDRRSYAPRPVSSATEFSDTDFEDDYPDEQFTARSASSQTTVSTFDSLKTPDTAGLGGFDFHFDDKQHDKASSVGDAEAVNLYFGFSPGGDVPVELPVRTSFEPHEVLKSPLSSRKDACDKLDETDVRSWTPEDVADWMFDAGHDDAVVDKFLDHDITGHILLDLQYDDLKELEISCHHKRNAVLDSIKYLRTRSRVSLAPMLPPDMLSEEVAKPNRERVASERRGRHQHATAEDVIAPGESVSIVAIEQVLPKQHVCSKGENCKKWKKQQMQLQRIREEMQAMPNTPMTISTNVSRPSQVAPSITASSDVFGPGLPNPSAITREKLRELTPVDPQESVRQFLGFQHFSPTSPSSGALSEKLRNMPRLTIPVLSSSSDAYFSPAGRHSATPRTVITPTLRRSKTPISAIRHPSNMQSASSKHERGSFNLRTPMDVYQLASPFSELDVPITSLPQEPLARDTSQSVPPNMQFGANLTRRPIDPVSRPQSVQQSNIRHVRRPSFAPPSVALLPEEEMAEPVTAISSSIKSPYHLSPPRRRPSVSGVTPQTAFPPQFPQSAGASINRPSTAAPTSLPSFAPRVSTSLPPRSSSVAPQSQSYQSTVPPPRPSTTVPTHRQSSGPTPTSRYPLSSSPPPRSSTTPPSPYTHTSTPHPDISPSNTATSSASAGTTNATSLSSLLLPPSTPQISGPMRRRLRTRLLRHEWTDGHFALTGTSLAMYKSEESYLRHSKALEYIDVDDYAIACSSAVSGKKLGASFFRSGKLGRSPSNKGSDGSRSAHPDSSSGSRGEACFGFSLIPIPHQHNSSSPDGGSSCGFGAGNGSSKKPTTIHFSSSSDRSKSSDAHHFAVGTRDERIDWMRELMLAKALKKGRRDTEGVEGARVEIDGFVV